MLSLDELLEVLLGFLPHDGFTGPNMQTQQTMLLFQSLELLGHEILHLLYDHASPAIILGLQVLGLLAQGAKDIGEMLITNLIKHLVLSIEEHLQALVRGRDFRAKVDTPTLDVESVIYQALLNDPGAKCCHKVHISVQEKDMSNLCSTAFGLTVLVLQFPPQFIRHLGASANPVAIQKGSIENAEKV
jgi:hypothetical protein